MIEERRECDERDYRDPRSPGYEDNWTDQFRNDDEMYEWISLFEKAGVL